MLHLVRSPNIRATQSLQMMCVKFSLIGHESRYSYQSEPSTMTATLMAHVQVRPIIDGSCQSTIPPTACMPSPMSHVQRQCWRPCAITPIALKVVHKTNEHRCQCRKHLWLRRILLIA